MSKLELRFPAKEGWIRARLSITPGTKITEKEALDFVTMGASKSIEYEVAAFQHFKTVIQFAFRNAEKIPIMIKETDCMHFAQFCIWTDNCFLASDVAEKAAKSGKKFGYVQYTTRRVYWCLLSFKDDKSIYLQ